MTPARRHAGPRLAAGIALALGCVLLGCTGEEPGPQSERQEPTAGPRVVLQTEPGRIVVEIDPVRAPVTAANFLRYVDEERLGGARFYRVVRADNQPDSPVRIAVIQGGLGDDEERMLPPIEHEATATTGLLHEDGVISMARLEPGTATSEFFICVGDQPELDFGGRRNPDGQGFAAFGRVVQGMDVVRRIHQRPADGQMLDPEIPILSVERAP